MVTSLARNSWNSTKLSRVAPHPRLHLPEQPRNPAAPIRRPTRPPPRQPPRPRCRLARKPPRTSTVGSSLSQPRNSGLSDDRFGGPHPDGHPKLKATTAEANGVPRRNIGGSQDRF